MKWNPDQYQLFKEERSAPFFDLANLLRPFPGLKIIDLGSGTGKLTATLAEKFPDAAITGIDASAEMLSQAPTESGVRFIHRSVEEQVALTEKYDIVFSNAALQWVNGHHQLFPKIMAMINPGGQLAVQMPAQHSNPPNLILQNLAASEKYGAHLSGFLRPTPVLQTQEYAKLLFAQGGTQINVFERIYPLVFKEVDGLLEWLNGSTLLPYLQQLTSELQSEFLMDYRQKLLEHFPEQPIFYPFKRILMHVGF